VEVVLNVAKGVTFVKISYFKLPNLKDQPPVANIQFGRNSLVRPKMLFI